MIQGQQRTRGFTLLEVLFAILILSISLFALIPLLTTAASIDRENYLNVRARAMAADVLDSLMGDAAPPFLNPSSAIDGGVTITRSWNVIQVGNLDNIAVTVQYTYHDQLKTFTLTAQKARSNSEEARHERNYPCGTYGCRCRFPHFYRTPLSCLQLSSDPHLVDK